MTTAQEYAQLAQIAADETASDVAVTESAKNVVLVTRDDIVESLNEALILAANAQTILNNMTQWSESTNVQLDGAYSAKHYAEIVSGLKDSVQTLSDNIPPSVSAMLSPLSGRMADLETSLASINTDVASSLQSVEDFTAEVEAIQQNIQDYVQLGLYEEDKVGIFGSIAAVRDATESMTTTEKDEYAEQLLTKILADNKLATRLRQSGYLVDATTGDVGVQRVYEQLNSMLAGVSRELVTVTNDINDQLAQEITRVETSLGNVTQVIQSEVQPLVDDVTAIKNTYGVSVNAQGHIAGFGLVQEVIDDTATSDFLISADTFSIVPPLYESASAPTNPYTGQAWKDTTSGTIYYYTGDAWGTTPISDTLFHVRTTPETVTLDNGDTITYEPGVYLNGLFMDSSTISNLQINTAQIMGSLTARHIEALELNADKITAGTMSGNRIEGGTMTAVTIHAGSIYAGYLNAAVLDAGSIKIGTNSVGKVYYEEGVSDSDTGTGTTSAKALLDIRAYNHSSTYNAAVHYPAAGTNIHDSPAWRYKDATVNPVGDASFKLSSMASQTYSRSTGVKRSVGTVYLKIYHGGALQVTGSKLIEMTSAQTNESVTQTLSVTAGAFTFTFDHTYVRNYASDPYWYATYLRQDAQTCSGNITCAASGYTYSDTSNIGVAFEISYSAASGGASGSDCVVDIEDVAENI